MSGGNELSVDGFIVGTCDDMCPESERCFRQRERLLHPLEMKKAEKTTQPMTDASLAIKRYCRSAAGQKLPEASELRTPDALTKTIKYLMEHILLRNDVEWTVVYDFVFDRLRAVRQDLMMQGLPGLTCIPMLEVIVRFHVYAGYRLCEEPLSKYDPIINKSHLQACLTRLMVLYDEDEAENISVFFLYRHQMEALNLIENLGNPHVLLRALDIPIVWRTGGFEFAFRMSLAFWMGNYYRTCRMVRRLPPMLAISAALQLPEIRRRALAVMSEAYSSSRPTYPLTKLRDALLFDTDESALKECSLYNISCQQIKTNCVVVFNKTTFNSAVKASLPTHRPSVDEALRKLNLELLIQGDK